MSLIATRLPRVPGNLPTFLVHAMSPTFHAPGAKDTGDFIGKTYGFKLPFGVIKHGLREKTILIAFETPMKLVHFQLPRFMTPEGNASFTWLP